jgi:hypothetical protein
MSKTSKYPIDIEELKKGDYISPEKIAEIYQIDLNDHKFNLYTLKLSQFIQQKTREMGNPYRTKIENRGVRVLLDSEAVRYEDNSADNKTAGIRRNLRNMMEISMSKLCSEDKNLLERNILKNSKRVLVLKNVDKEIKALPSPTRDTPKMIGQ